MWWRVGRVPYDFNEYLEGIANAAINLHKSGKYPAERH